jgi:hypothetical protein
MRRVRAVHGTQQQRKWHNSVIGYSSLTLPALMRYIKRHGSYILFWTDFASFQQLVDSHCF